MYYAVAAMWLDYKLSGNPFYSGLAGFLRYYLLHFTLPVHSLIDGPLKHPRHHTSFAMHSYINHSYFTHFDLSNSPTTIIITPCIVAFLSRQFRLSRTIESFTLLPHRTQLLKGTSTTHLRINAIDLICTTLSGILVALFGAITLYVIDSFTSRDYWPFLFSFH